VIRLTASSTRIELTQVIEPTENTAAWPAELPAAQTGLDPDQGPDYRSTLIVETL
jgi:hypothetical protein